MSAAIFLSYASQDADTARRICDALRAAGLEVWFDQSELRGGDAWDASIRKQIKECALFVPIVSANTNAREEGYFRLEWKLAVDRSHLMADDKAFFFPVILGDVAEPTARVPDRFRERQWTRLNAQESFDSFAARVAKVLDERGAQANTCLKGAPDGEFGVQGDDSQTRRSRVGGNPVPFEVESKTLGPRLRGDDISSSGAGNDVSSSPKAPQIKQRAPAQRRYAWLIAGALGLLIAAALFGIRHLTTTPNEITSIAVLPFQAPTTTADADTDYLSVGLAETLIYQLSRLPKLKVSPASSVYRYKGKEIDPLKVGSELGVAAVMTGRLVQRGESLSISVELVDVRNNKSLWGEKYDRKMADLLATQRDIATEIARKLQLTLSGESQQLLAKRFTDNNEAYQLYLKGQYLYAKRGKDNLARAIDLFQKAIKIDPNFAKAYVGLADTYSMIAFNRDMPASEVVPRAISAAARAIALDPALAEAHAAKATMAAMDWQWQESRHGFARATEIDGNVAEIRFRHALFNLIPFGDCQEAIAEIQRAIELEPQSTVYAAALTSAYLCDGQPQKALDQARKVYALEPDHLVAASWLNAALLAKGNAAEIQREIVGLPRTGEKRAPNHWLGIYYAKTGQEKEAREELDALIKSIGSTGASEYAVAMLAANLGERDLAFKWLERAYSAKLYLLAHLKRDAFMTSLRDDPRFADLLKRMGLPT
jgi:TolB-like protein